MYQIRASFALAEYRPMTYWWPLLCEAMRCQGLGFDNPRRLPDRVGSYIFFRTNSLVSEHKLNQPFRQLWDDLYAQQCRGIYAPFWSVLPPDIRSEEESEPELVLKVGIRQEPETGGVTFYCDLVYLGEAQAKPPEADTREAKRRVHRWLEVLKEISRLCGPCTAELTHERWGIEYRMGTIGKPLALEWWDSPTNPIAYEGEVVQERLPDGAVLSVVTPLHLPWRDDEIPITLHGEEVPQE
jgi:hypothetical protein